VNLERPYDFVSGSSGEVSGIRATARAIAADALDDAIALSRRQTRRLQKASRELPRQRVLALAIEREGVPNLLAAARVELLQTRHQVRLATTTAGTHGKFENLNALLEREPVNEYDWLLVVDDDVALPKGFLDSFLFLATRFGLQLAQPAHRHRSHAAWQVTRRRRDSVVRETVFVEIGPVFAFHRTTFGALLPFPALRYGWGLDLHWSAIANEHSWRAGIIDATAIRHGMRLIAASYDRRAAVQEARAFLASRPYTKASDAQLIRARHRSWER
jgi:uncharacterized protein DUF707